MTALQPTCMTWMTRRAQHHEIFITTVRNRTLLIRDLQIINPLITFSSSRFSGDISLERRITNAILENYQLILEIYFQKCDAPKHGQWNLN